MNMLLNSPMGRPKSSLEVMNSPGEVHLNDFWIRFLMIPSFGIFIPHATGLFRGTNRFSIDHAFGYLLFVSLAFLIWHGNRWFLIKQRTHYDWFHHPIRKLVLLVFANVFFTVPITVLVLWNWYYFVAMPSDWNVIRIVCLVNVICVLFITHVYETIYLIRQREEDQLRLEKTHRARAEAELEALKQQLDPHFIFNSLNTLSQLIEEQSEQAGIFTEHLGDVYRYILASKDRALVPLKDEVHFVRSYLCLLQLRFGSAIDIRWPDLEAQNTLIPPMSLQILIENAVKHNQLSADRPLKIDCDIVESSIIVSHQRRPRRKTQPGTGTGLRNLSERFLLITQSSIRIEPDTDYFRVALPLVQMPT